MATKSEIQAKYAQLAAQVGDLYMRIQPAQEHLKTLGAKMSELLKERQDLEEQLKTASDEDVVEVTPSAE
tara:strand:+ start:99 stop:308 length:210 start_codon:yes stop_codon:yes gene_type:complete